MTTQLPSKLSDLLELAVRDAQACEADPDYVLEMREWHTPELGVCAVCMAGAVMAKTFRVPASRDCDPSSFLDPRTRLLLLRIDDMRHGFFPESRSFVAAEKARRLILDDFDDGLERAPWSTYLKAVEILREAGL